MGGCVRPKAILDNAAKWGERVEKTTLTSARNQTLNAKACNLSIY